MAGASRRRLAATLNSAATAISRRDDAKAWLSGEPSKPFGVDDAERGKHFFRCDGYEPRFLG